MDDDLLADDGQYKDDGLDELDIDEEAALLGLSDEEIERTSLTEDQELEYVDEDGNPVDIGENNAELYELANTGSNKRSPPEDDVLDLDLDAEIESFTEENPDLMTRESPIKSFNERQCKDNLIPISTRNEREKPPPVRRKDSRASPDMAAERSKSDLPYPGQGQSTRNVAMDSFGASAEYDEESEDEIADDHRERFKSERSNIITLTPAKNRDIPDTLESVISVEETAKVQAFLENEQKRKMRFKGKGPMRMKNPPRFSRPNQSFPTQHQHPQFSTPDTMPSYQPPTVSTQAAQSRKILINPHFRGVHVPPTSSEPMMPMNQPPRVSAPPPQTYETQNFAPNMYPSHHDNTHQVNVAPPVFNTPPPMPYKPPEYSLLPPPQQHMQQAPPPIWQPPPEIPPPVSYANPPLPLNYGDPLAQVPSYHNSYNSPNSFQNVNYSPPQIPPPQPMQYSQPPPPVHIPSSSYVPATSAQTNVTHMNFQSSQRQQSNVQKPYQEHRNMPRSTGLQNQRINTPQNQRFPRQAEKRPSGVNMKQVPMKIARIEHQPRKNVHVNNSNIREIPLVDTLPNTQQNTFRKPPAAVEEEDEKTKELRRKIEEQKLLREQILKRKEERRRQMAAQRLMDLKKRQAEQNKNVISIPRVDTIVPVKAPSVQTIQKAKISVKERIGIPMSKPQLQAKKKVIVVRKKAIPPANSVVPDEQKKIAGMGQRVGTQATKQPQRIQVKKELIVDSPSNQNQLNQQKPQAVSTSQPRQASQLQKTNQPAKVAVAVAKKIITKAKSGPEVRRNVNQHNQKGPIQQRLGNRTNFQRPFFPNRTPHQQGHGPPMSPRFNGPRGPQFQEPPFMEHRMRFPQPGPPRNDMHMPGPPFPEPRPPLLPFHGPGDGPPFNQFMFEPCEPHFRMQDPGFQNFRPRSMDMFPDQFPSPQFQMPPMRPQMFKPTNHVFHRPRFQGQNMRQRPNVNANHQKKPVGGGKNTAVNPSPPKSIKKEKESTENPNALPAKESDTKVVKNTVQNPNQMQTVSVKQENSGSHSVSVENLSSSTNEVQLKKLCSAVGVVEHIQLLKDQRKAIIKFKQPCQALNFQKKYQRYMLDLAMIQVSLLPK